MKIDITKKYRYRNSDSARILCVDGPCIHRGEPQPVVSMDASGEVNAHFPSGRFNSALEDSPWDLIEVREPREWVLRGHSLGLGVGVIHDGPSIPAGEQLIRVREIID